ncbi:MAG: hypothetical protein J4O14_05080 [Chloroflexi bacterium]|nr:hypothetical protein [Chloroflexota bacterium]MCI0783962.1 hypothetical protein [Chloroflexota bacterium]MCI0817624.1 hypothetical protein [Chloroflexota bacterium]MCI0819574.1 hypothetical protein [Chloroflexota bacterium]MCI0831447.1 hypothetical protein [Chloroflexota bacterium]
MPASIDSDGDPGEELRIFPEALTHNLELAATILMAIAAVLTAWTAFQSSKWSGVQAIEFSEAGAARTESTVFSTRAGQQALVDISGFTNWLNALQADIRAGAVDPPPSAAEYEPAFDSLSGFLFVRFREEFKPAVDAWLDTDPFTDPEAPTSPFVMPEYDLEANNMADDLMNAADESARLARVANQNSDDYVINAVLAAMVLFFAGLSTKLLRPRNRLLTLGLGVVLLGFTVYLVVRLPIEI